MLNPQALGNHPSGYVLYPSLKEKNEKRRYVLLVVVTQYRISVRFVQRNIDENVTSHYPSSDTLITHQLVIFTPNIQRFRTSIVASASNFSAIT